MVALDPTVALETCENALRQLMTHAYRDAYGDDWLDRITTEDQRNEWAGRAATEQTTRKGVAVVPSVGLAYANFYELLSFVENHWEPLAPALGKRATTVAMLKRFDNLRNTVAHHRELVTFEKELYSGIAGQTRNQVTIFMTTQDPAGDHYPRIESVIDSFGNTYNGEAPDLINHGIETAIVLHPGDVVTFTATAFDGQDRDLRFELRASLLGIEPRQKVIEKAGRPVELTWHVTDEEVGTFTAMGVYLYAEGTKYHRHTQYDYSVRFAYRVDPPN